MFVVDKEIGETPLECLERVRAERSIAADVPMTYAGRLDPLASGKLLLLVGDECKAKEKYLGLDKEYEVEVLFGVKTDTGDALGLIEKVEATGVAMASFFSHVYNVYTLSSGSKKEISTAGSSDSGSPWSKFCGKFNQAYPVYSSKTVAPRSDLGKKRQLHDLARSGELPDEMPTKEVEIFSIEEIPRATLCTEGYPCIKINGKDVAAQAVTNILKVKGDFRQEEIMAGWNKFEREHGAENFSVVKLRVACSSGTYMRALAERIGAEAETVTFAFSIKRTMLGKFSEKYGKATA